MTHLNAILNVVKIFAKYYAGSFAMLRMTKYSNQW